MDSSPSKTGIVASLAAGLTLFTLAPPTEAQHGSIPAECEEMVRVADEGRSLEEIRNRIERARPSQLTLERCIPFVAENPKFETLVRQQAQDMQRQLQIPAIRPTATPKPFEQIPANQRVIRARNEGAAKMNVISARAPDPVPLPDPQGSPPAISAVTPSPVVPGANIVVEGTGFGTSGTVRLLLDGKSFNATVNQWTSGWVSAYLSTDISGVSQTQGAVIEVRPQGAAAISRTVSFVPVYESKMVRASAGGSMLSGGTLVYPFPGEGYAVVFQHHALQNHWRVTSKPVATLSSFVNGIECKIDGPPAAAVADVNLSTRLYLAWGAFQLPVCHLDIEIEGPRGLDPGI